MKNDVERIDRTLGWESLPELVDWVVKKAIHVQQIPAPTFYEEQRARFIKDEFKVLNLQQIETDDMCNVYGLIPGKNQHAPSVLISAHMDTVFSADTDLKTQKDGCYFYGPGLGDNSIGVAGLLGLAYFLNKYNLHLERDVWFVTTSREEGLGDLGGMRAAFERFRGKVGWVINLEGLAFGHVYHAGIAVRRLHITATAAGGHSWLHFGRSSAVHAIVELAARIITLQPPSQPRTTFNIGMIEGGESINSIATNAGLWLDLRSEERATLIELENEVRALVEALTTADVSFAINVVGDRPSGYLPPDHELVQGALAALDSVGFRGTLETGSTDANVPLAVGCPAVTIGITRGGNAHRLDEYIETKSIALGLRQLIVLTLAAAGYPTMQK